VAYHKHYDISVMLGSKSYTWIMWNSIMQLI